MTRAMKSLVSFYILLNLSTLLLQSTNSEQSQALYDLRSVQNPTDLNSSNLSSISTTRLAIPEVDTTHESSSKPSSTGVHQQLFNINETKIKSISSEINYTNSTQPAYTSIPTYTTSISPNESDSSIHQPAQPAKDQWIGSINPYEIFNRQDGLDDEMLIGQLQSNAPTKPVIATPPISSGNRSDNDSYDGFHPLLIYSIRYEIRSYDIFHIWNRSHTQISNPYDSNDQQIQSGVKNTKTLIAGLKNTIGLDFFLSDDENFIFWIDVIEERIYRGTLLNGTISNVEMVVQHGLATAEGLAIDWIGRNIYWVESTLDHIEVASMNGSSRRTLIAGDMDSPRSIAVDPRYGLMFWSDWDKKRPRIERASMSGDERQVIVHIKDFEGNWPNGITLDYDSLRVYWIDANSDSIHSVDYDGRDHHEHLKHIKSLGHPFSITLFDSNVFWTDWKTNSVSMANKVNGLESKEIQKLTSRLFDIKVLHPNRQPKINSTLNPCYVNNGGCTHLCLLSSNHTRKCECPHLMKLSLDGGRCEPYERVLLIGKSTEIRAVDINEPLHNVMAPIGAPKVFSPRQIEFDSKSKTIFWVDSQTNEVKRAQLSSNGIDTIIDVIIESPSGLALDWISGNIYVTSAPQQRSTTGKIFISNLNGEYISILMDSAHGIINPKSIAVHPMLGLLFCVDETKDSDPIIFVSSMDGSNKTIIATKADYPELEAPNSLAIDYSLDRVYWVNQANNSSRSNNSIHYYDIHSGKIFTVLNGLDALSKRINPNVLCVDGDNLIIGGRIESESIFKAPKDNITAAFTLINQNSNLEQVFALRVYNASAQTGTNACYHDNGGCSQLCIPTNSTHRSCKCTMGYNNSPTNESACIGKDSFLIYSCNYGMKGISLEPNSHPGEYYLPPIHKAFRASSIDYVHREDLIYWVDNEEGSITRINRDTTNYQSIVQGLESEESICIDWVAGNIYWLDPYYDIIEVARLNGSNRYVIVSGDMDKANGIVVNPLKGYIIWSDIGAFPKIERARLDGGDRRVIVSTNVVHIDDLAIDYVEDFIYWIDSSSALIERIKEDGSMRRTIYRGNNGLSLKQQNHLVSIAIHKGYLYIADSLNQGSITRCDKNNATEQVLVQDNLGDAIRDIAIFAEQPLPLPEENPCVFNNGGCQDLCLFLGKHGHKRCICSHGKLKQDRLTCEPYDTFVLFSKLTQIDSLHIRDEESTNNSPYQPIVMESRSSIISLTVDYSAKRVIYSEIAHDQICSVFFNGTDRRVLVEKQSLVEGIAFADDRLYWTSIQDNSISRLNTTSRGIISQKCEDANCRNASVEKIIKLGSDDKPRGIAVDRCTGYVYWTNWNRYYPSIQRAEPENGYKIQNIIDTDIKVPNGITIDHMQRKIYWCDARLDKIETCNMDGTDRVVLIHAFPQHPFALATWDNYVFWTDWLARGVYRADKYTGQQLSQIKKVIQRPMGIAVAAEEPLHCPIDPCSPNLGACPENHTCYAHSPGPNITRKVECRPNELVHQMRPFIPVSRLTHCKPGSPCPPDESNLQSYHDIIRDTLERFNLTDELTKVIKQAHTDGGLNSPVNQGQYFNTMTEDHKTKKTQPFVINYSNENHGGNSSTLSNYVSQLEKSTPPATTQRSATSVRPPVKTTPSPAMNELRSTTFQTAKKTDVIMTSKPIIPTETATQIPLINTSSLAPCQIVPAALQPTTDSSSGPDCRSQTEFKCYLSEKLLCIPADRRCDGNSDCPSKEDENDCHLSKRGPYNARRETNWHRYVTVIMVIFAATVAALFLVFGSKGKRRWFVSSTSAFNHRRMFDDNGTNIEISNPMFDEDDGTLNHCAFSIDLNERTTNFSNPLYERQFLLMNDKHVTSN